METTSDTQGNIDIAARPGKPARGGSGGCPFAHSASENAPAATKPYRIPDGEAHDVEHIKDPYPALARWRAACPVAYREQPSSYTALTYGPVRSLLKDRRASRDLRDAAPGTHMHLLRTVMPDTEANILFLDGPDHARLRGLVSKAFTPKAIERLRPRIEMWADRLLDTVADEGRFDLMEAFAMPFPTIVIAELLGVDPEHHEKFKHWSMQTVRLLDVFATPEQQSAALAAREAFGAYLVEQIADRRQNPRDDLFTALIEAQEGDDRLTDREIINTCRLLLSAGNLTTTDLIGNAVVALLEHPEQLALVRADPSLVDKVVEETLRWDPPVLGTQRIPLEDARVSGVGVPKGSTVNLSLAAANRDPATHDNADAFDITRHDTHHLSFGGGVHFCLGAHLARLEARIALSAILRRLPKLRLAHAGQVERDTIPGFRGHRVLEVQAD